ncbi:C39 family peptidase [Actinoplanes awajinensis]|uniref:Peptidase C39-like domain-containing protein n=1 Tax=Actinoplanes awajinensis subsp. mycoplanecinus TaxID=135947 RepID=A0A0X3VCL4_9ACTN|nr:C39 family peptidase [Actinoplanes awajinensis]KUL42470.1 hypothetical protein ADL15_00935 [Actinoplanes awajinensis subsp. mycoplanecinus]
MGVHVMVNHSFRRALTVAMGGLLCVTLTAGIGGQAAAAAPRLTGPVFAAAADEPDVDETVALVDDVVEEDTPDWVEADAEAGYSASALGIRFVGESAFQAVSTAGVTGGGDVSVAEAASTTAETTLRLKKIASALADAARADAEEADGTVSAAAATSKKLSLKQYGQAKGYWCGPASGFMMLKFLKAGKSKYNDAKLSQKALATSAHMSTEANHGTAWDSKKFTTGLNRWRGNSFYVQVKKPSAATTRGAFTMSIRNNVPIAGDTVEFSGGAHYNNHPRNKTIGHWIVGYGHANNGKTAFWADPSTTVWRGVSAKFSYSTNSFSSKFLQSNGIVY